VAAAAAAQEPSMGERLANAHRRFQERLRRAAAVAAGTAAPAASSRGRRSEDIFGGPLGGGGTSGGGVGGGGATVSESRRSSVLFADASEGNGEESGGGAVAAPAVDEPEPSRDDKASSCSDLLSYAGTPEPATAVVGTKGKGKIIGGSPGTGSIMERPRASYRVGCADCVGCVDCSSEKGITRRVQKSRVGTIKGRIEKGTYKGKESSRVVAGIVRTAIGVEEMEGSRLGSSKGSVTGAGSG
jgi:hypothetical protein